MDQRGDWTLTEAIDHESGRGDPFAAAVRATRMPMVITNPRLPDNPIVYCNKAFQDLSGYDAHEIVGRNCRFLQGDGTDQDAVDRIRAAIDRGGDVEATLLNYRKDGTPFWNALYLSPVRDDDGTISFFFASQLDVTDRVEADAAAIARREAVEQEVAERTEALREALEAKTVLLHELDHRVKNNLTMIGSLLRLQSRAVGDPTVSAHIETMLRRIDALGTVHRRLYQSPDVTRFDVGALLNDLATDLVAALGPAGTTVQAEIEPIEIASGHASAIGLVLNEILVGAIMQVAAGRGGLLRLSTARDGDFARLEVEAVGHGAAGPAVGDLGPSLVDRLCRQVGITTAAAVTPTGSRVSLSLPLGLLS